jgi:hypothetical protein
MSDESANGQHGHFPARTPRTEFRVYFAIIFAVALPFAVLGWIVRTAVTGRMPDRNAVSTAWADARSITPLIFRA